MIALVSTYRDRDGNVVSVFVDEVGSGFGHGGGDLIASGKTNFLRARANGAHYDLQFTMQLVVGEAVLPIFVIEPAE